MLAARMAGAHTLIHQQDVNRARPTASRALARRNHRQLPSSARPLPTRSESVVTGNPVRAEILQPTRVGVERLGLERGVPLLVVTGGGTGALGLNRLVAAARAAAGQARAGGASHGSRARRAARTTSPRYRAVEFLVDEMPDVLAAATRGLTRAGMGTLSELAALEKPAVVVPMPGSHQWANAHAFARLGAVEVADQDALSPGMLAQRILNLMDDPERRAALGRALHASMPANAAESIATQLLSLAPTQRCLSGR